MIKTARRSSAVRTTIAAAAASAAVAVVGGCNTWPWSPRIGPAASGHVKEWMDSANPAFHGIVVKEANGFTNAKWQGMACSACHAASGAATNPPSCAACHAGGPDGSPGHPAGFADFNSPNFHGSVLRSAGLDYRKALSGGLTCAACHAGENAAQASPMARAPSCFACHSGGPDGSAGHPDGYANPADPDFHGTVVVAAQFDFKKALAGGLPCSACHGGESPSQPSPNSAAPRCFACHIGGPTGGAGHPVGWSFVTGGTAGTAVWTCTTCHSDDRFKDPGTLAVSITLREDPGVWPTPAPSTAPTASPSASPFATP